MRFHIVNLGCKVNKVESDALSAQCLSAGFARASLEESDLVVVNTCAVTGEAEKKTRKTVRHVCKMATHAHVIVTGCSAALHKDVYEQMSPRVTVLDKSAVACSIERIIKAPECGECAYSKTSNDAKSDDAGASARTLAVPVGEGFRTRVGIKVQDGCDNACTYCIVHVARGKATSRPVPEIIREIQLCAQAGAREFVLSGINLGSYRQIYQGKEYRLADLLRLLLKKTADFDHLRAQEDAQGCPRIRFRIGSIEPMDISDDLIDLIAQSRGRICRHLHLPLQAGSSKVLNEMNRPYTAQAYSAVVDKMRRSMPMLSLSTDIIVGFPGETDEDFQQTCTLARSCGFSKIHVFPYSMREGTPAAARSDQVAASIKSERAMKLREIAKDLTRQDKESRIGTTEWALVEAGGVAMTESYYSVSVSGDCEVGTLVPYRF